MHDHFTATYSPEDNKLRLSSASRLDPELYARVKAAGFSWAPRQEIFVAPMWTPSREDLLLELCGEIGDEDTSLVERAEERAERFEDYSDSRAKDAHQAHQTVKGICDGIPFGQPILVGHHSERHARKDAERIENGMRRAVKMWETSQYWQSRAAGAIRHAKYKELPAVRARRIKGLEADIRRVIASYTPKNPDQIIMQQPWNAGPDAERVPHVYCGGGSRGGSWVAVSRLEGIKERSARWLAHYENRLAYEKAMLDEAGASSLLDKKPRPAQLPICNYRAPGGITTPNRYNHGETMYLPQVEMTQTQYAAINTDYKGTRIVDNSHRVRSAMIRHDLVCVFLTDAKVHDKPAPIELTTPAPRIVPTHTPRPAPEPTPFDAMRDTLKAGVQVVTAPQLFPTPPELARRMAREAGILAGCRVLEPSAGTGNIVKAIIDNATGAGCVRVVAVEINPALADGLRTQRDRTLYANENSFDVRCADFLQCNGDLGKFDVVLMNPPFENGSDIKHIKHALTMLKPGGRLVAICANGPRQNEQLKPLADSWEVLPADTFKASGTSVNTALFVKVAS